MRPRDLQRQKGQWAEGCSTWASTKGPFLCYFGASMKSLFIFWSLFPHLPNGWDTRWHWNSVPSGVALEPGLGTRDDPMAWDLEASGLDWEVPPGFQLDYRSKGS